jgi:Fe-S-cluster containining protein
MDDEPEAFVMLRQGKRVMVLRHQRGRCRYLGKDDRCTIYAHRPLGCRIFPFDPDFSSRGTLKRLALIEATECPYTLDGTTRVEALRALDDRHTAAQERYHQRVAEWNRIQRRRRRQQKAAQTAREFLEFLGVQP